MTATRERELSGRERTRLSILALPTTALALAVTVASTYLGEVTRGYTHNTIVIGLIIGSEGIMALWVPLLAGAWSDALRTPIGGRLPFVLGGGIPAAAALVVVGASHTLIDVAVAAVVFFGFYFVAYEPYRALYPDLVGGDEVAGRAQSTQALARGLGTGLALLGGGLLLGIGRAVPFVVAAVILVAALAAFTLLLLRSGLPDQEHSGEGVREVASRVGRLVLHNATLRNYLIANALWETALAALKAFIILYLVAGLHYGLTTASLMVGGVSLVILLGAAGAGKAGDRFGKLRVLQYALVAYGGGYLVLVLTTSRPLMAAAIPFVAVGGGSVMTLAYAVLMPLMPDAEHGALTGFYSLSRGIGIVAGPILAGVVIRLTQSGPYGSTHGFQAMWLVCCAAAFGSLPFVRALRRSSRAEQRSEG